jgi:hypothetical protein
MPSDPKLESDRDGHLLILRASLLTLPELDVGYRLRRRRTRLNPDLGPPLLRVTWPPAAGSEVGRVPDGIQVQVAGE